MYCSFYGFTEKPFDVTPDHKFLYRSPGHQEALASLIYGIRQRRGFMTVIGEVGTGKTTLINATLDDLGDDAEVAYVFNTDVTFEQLFLLALLELGLAKPEEHLSKVEGLHRLNTFAIQKLAGKGNVVLIIDEAQNLDLRCMENLRLLSNLETRKHKLVQIVLSGQPELDAKLNRPELRQLAQRISLRRYITPLSEGETYDYIKHRLNMVNYKGNSLFNRRVQEMVWHYSGGVPRKINILCDNALLIAFGLEKKKIKEEVMAEAIKDLSWSPFINISDSPVSMSVPHLRNKGSSTTPSYGRPSFQSKGAASPRRLIQWSGLVIFVFLFVTVGMIIVGQHFNKLRGSSSQYENPFPMASTDGQRNLNQSVFRAPIVKKNETQTAKEPLPGTIGEESVAKMAVSVAGKSNETQAMIVVDVKEKYKDPSTISEVTKEEKNGPQKGQHRVVIVEEGDFLSKILIRNYGSYSDQILKGVLRENPEIRDPKKIWMGQAIKLPPIEDVMRY